MRDGFRSRWDVILLECTQAFQRNIQRHKRLKKHETWGLLWHTQEGGGRVGRENMATTEQRKQTEQNSDNSIPWNWKLLIAEHFKNPTISSMKPLPLGFFLGLNLELMFLNLLAHLWVVSFHSGNYQMSTNMIWVIKMLSVIYLKVIYIKRKMIAGNTDSLNLQVLEGQLSWAAGKLSGCKKEYLHPGVI